MLRGVVRAHYRVDGWIIGTPAYWQRKIIVEKSKGYINDGNISDDILPRGVYDVTYSSNTNRSRNVWKLSCQKYPQQLYTICRTEKNLPAVQKGSQSYFVDPSKIVWDGWNNDGTNCLTADLDRIQRRHMAVCIGLLDEERFKCSIGLESTGTYAAMLTPTIAILLVWCRVQLLHAGKRSRIVRKMDERYLKQRISSII